MSHGSFSKSEGRRQKSDPRLRVLSLLSAVICAAAIAPLAAKAQGYPSKPVRIILPYLGGADFVGRLLAAKLTPGLGQQVVVDPRPGAGGNIGHEAGARAAPDGYTLMLASTPFVLNPILNPKLRYDVARDFAPIAQVAALPNVLAVHPSVPVKSLRELVQLARRNPGKLAYGSGTTGSTSHLAGELFKSLSKTSILLVPYKGASFALVGAMSGEVDFVMPAASAVQSYAKANRMRVLAVLDQKRNSALPDVPTAAEAGMPQLLIVNWYVLTAPTGTPRAVLQQLNAETARVMQSSETRSQFANMGGEATGTTPDEAVAFLRAETERWSKVIRDAGIKAE
jgi:tripartite-type tricarboxylate transporter receptor subunit TctC